MTTILTGQENKTFYRQLITVGIPVLIQQLIVVGLNLVDTIMVGKLSENALAAVGAANQVYFMYSVVMFGIFSGAAVYTVQYWGVRDLKSLRKILGIDYVMCLAITIPVVILAFFASPVLMSFFTDDTEVISLGRDYMRIACFSYIFKCILELLPDLRQSWFSGTGSKGSSNSYSDSQDNRMYRHVFIRIFVQGSSTGSEIQGIHVFWKRYV